MNSEEKIFKSLLEEKIASKSFEFDEENWVKASELIIESRKKEKRKILPFLFFLFLIIGVTSFLALISKTTKTLTNINVKPKNKIAINENNQAKVEVSNKPLLTKKSIRNKTIAIKKEALKDSLVAIAHTSKTKQKNNVAEVSKTKTASFVPTQKTISKKMSVLASSTIKKVKHNDVISISSTIVNTTKQNFSEEAHSTLDLFANTSVSVVDTTKQEIIINSKETLLSQLLLDTGKTTTPAKANTNTSIIDSSKKDVLQKDSLKQVKHFFGVEFGANYLVGWNNPTKRDANGLNPFIGFNYTHLMSSNLYYSTGLYYTTVTNLSYSKHIVKNTRYRFSEESNVFEFTPTTLHYIGLPLKIGYVFRQKNSIGIGGNVAYLYTTNGNVFIYNEQAGKQSNATSIKTNGYAQGFSNIDVQLNLFYRRQLFKNMFVNAEFVWGIKDVKENAFFNYAHKENNTGIKLTLIYNLFKK